jgi:hypothetical protein
VFFLTNFLHKYRALPEQVMMDIFNAYPTRERNQTMEKKLDGRQTSHCRLGDNFARLSATRSRYCISTLTMRTETQLFTVFTEELQTDSVSNLNAFPSQGGLFLRHYGLHLCEQ